MTIVGCTKDDSSIDKISKNKNSDINNFADIYQEINDSELRGPAIIQKIISIHVAVVLK